MDTVVQIVLGLAVLGPSVILHEVSHGAVALRFGDDTAKRAGRLTLNPVKHIDLFGTVLLPVMLFYFTGAAFGYAKPVPVNPGRMRRPRDHGMITSLAGPAVNIALVLLAALVARTFGWRSILLAPSGQTLAEFLFLFGLINIILAAFNLLPIPPLDGSAVVERFLPRAWLPGWHKIRQYSMGILILLVFVFDSVLNSVFGWANDIWLTLAGLGGLP